MGNLPGAVSPWPYENSRDYTPLHRRDVAFRWKRSEGSTVLGSMYCFIFGRAWNIISNFFDIIFNLALISDRGLQN